MKPGREMDAKVAWEVFRYAFREPRDTKLSECAYCGRRILFSNRECLCHYSTSDDAAWPVVRAMWDEGFCVWIENPAQLGGYVDAAFSTNGLINGSGNSESFAEAVCVAALRALGVER